MTDTTAAATAAAGPAVPAPGSTPRRFHWTPGLVTGLVLLGAVVLVGIVAPLLLQEQADTMAERAASPSAAHPLGTDQAGHDMLARSLVATRLTLVMTLGATAIAVLVGIVAGTAVWLLPRRAREVCLRVIDAMVAFPGLLLALVVAAILGAGAVPAGPRYGCRGRRMRLGSDRRHHSTPSRLDRTRAIMTGAPMNATTRPASSSAGASTSRPTTSASTRRVGPSTNE